jgi:release factor glutamine methyltransferase
MSEQPWTILKLLQWTTDYFKKKSVAEPRASAEILLAHVLSKDRLFLYLNYERPLDSRELLTFRECITRRLAGEPNQYITGTQEFWSLPVRVTPDVLIPRPETETLVEAVLDIVHQNGSVQAQPRILDLGTGSGAIAIALAQELPTARIFAMDLSMAALRLAQKNARRLQMEQRLCFICSNMFAGLSRVAELFDVVVTNPPYVSHLEFPHLPREVRDYEPRHALDGGPDGLAIITPIIVEAPTVLRQGGFLVLEMGAGQMEMVSDLVTQTKSYKNYRILKDYSGIDRVLVAQSG